MNYLYEYSDTLNRPFETFLFDTAVHPFPVRSHWHHYVEMIYIVEGNIIATVNEVEYYMEEGDLILFHRGDIHSLSASTYDRAVYEVLKFDSARLTVNSGVTPKLTTLLNAARDQKGEVFFDASVTKQFGLGDLITACREEMDGGRLGYDVSVHARLCILLVRLIRLWQDAGIDFSNLTEYISDDELTIRNVLEYIDMHSDERLRVEELAKKCNMSYSHFSKCFKDLYGRSCKEHLELLKIEKAEELLCFTDMSMNDISQELGFSDCSHFIRVFKKLKGVTPRMFMKTHAVTGQGMVPSQRQASVPSEGQM